MPRRESILEIYHRETKYSEEGLARKPRSIDASSQPPLFKEYRSDKQINLTPFLPFPKNPFTGQPMRPAAGPGPRPFGLPEISRLLYFTNGVTGIVHFASEMSRILRAAPSAGALYPTEIYAAARGVKDLPDGLYSYLVRDHCLVPLWDGDYWAEILEYTFDHDAVKQSRLVLLLSGIYRRSEWRYEDRAYRRILLDTGHVLGNLVLAARREGFAPYPIGGFVDDALGGLLFLEADEEVILAAVALPDRDSHRPEAIKGTQAWPSPPRIPESIPESPSLMRRLHAAGAISSPLEHRRSERKPFAAARTLTGAGIALPAAPIDLVSLVQDLVLKRRSTRAFSGAPINAEDLGTILHAAYRETLSASLDRRLYFEPDLLSTYVVATSVEGLPAGVYRYYPETQEAVEVRRGEFRQQVWHFALTQELGRDAAATVIHVADMDDALAAHGDRAYRYVHLDAGHVGQTMNLVAVARGRGVSGIGGFFDDEVNGLLDLPFRKMIVYLTAIGVSA